jgi:hypothetical protein
MPAEISGDPLITGTNQYDHLNRVVQREKPGHQVVNKYTDPLGGREGDAVVTPDANPDWPRHQ